jgi:uncharacterized protein
VDNPSVENQPIKIGLISDTHGYMDDRIIHHLKGCDEVWHLGDVGQASCLEPLTEHYKVRGVYGNIDGTEVRSQLREFGIIKIQGITFLLIHIANAISRYNPKVRELIQKHNPNILVCGHSHILKVKHDTRFNLLYINPGAAGNVGFQKVRTLITFEIAEGEMKNLKVVELGQRSTKSVH